MCQALRSSGVRPYVLSLGRGSTDGSSESFRSFVCRVGGVPTVYAPFSHKTGWSKVLSLFGLLVSVRRLAKHENRAIIFYNRLPAYLPALITARRSGYLCFLDLEDGEVNSKRLKNPLKHILSTLVPKLFDRNCHDGALIACSALAKMTKVRPTYSYYGTVGDQYVDRQWGGEVLRCLMSGTLSPDTGAETLIDAIREIRRLRPTWSSSLQFEVTGKGESLSEFEQLAAEQGFPKVRVHGRTSDEGYKEILKDCNVGLALKPVGGAFADTTFPSKVIEFASSGMLVLSTDISDVRNLFGDGARYLERSDPRLLIERFAELVLNPNDAAQCAKLGNIIVRQSCSVEHAGKGLRRFIFGSEI